MKKNNLLLRELRPRSFRGHHLGIFGVLLFLPYFMNPLYGQKVMNLPTPYYMPIDYINPGERLKFATTEWPSNKGDEFWMAVSDRSENSLYNKPNGKEVAQLDFMDYAWVVSEKGDWVEVIQGRLEEKKIGSVRGKSGWIKKENLLLWPYSLIDESTQISKKAFLLNKVDQIEKVLKVNDKSLVKLYDGPNSSKEIKNTSVYEVYFVYKREGDRLLIGANSFFNYANVRENIIGWVDNYRVQVWNQRLVLEPNWENEVYNARKNDASKRVRGFSNQKSADIFSKTGKFNNDDILWDNDPVKLPQGLRSTSNSNRAVGEIFRFPVFSMSKNGFIESGALARIPTRKSDGSSSGELDQSSMISLNGELKRMLYKRNHLNVYFLIEATRELKSARLPILAAISNLESALPDEVSINYGAAVYRDTELESTGDHFKLQKLKSNKDHIVDFLSNQVFDQGNNLDAWTNLRWAMNEVLLKGELPANEQNLIIVVGSHADLTYNKARSRTSPPGSLIEDNKYEKLEDRLDKLGVNLAFIQVQNDVGNVYSKFAEDGRTMMVNIATRQYAALSKEIIETYKPTPPFVPELMNENEIAVQGVSFGYIRRPNKGSSLKDGEILSSIEYAIRATWQREADAYQALSAIVNGGLTVDDLTEEFAPIIWSIIDKNLKKGDYNKNALDQLMDEKIKLYQRVFLPVSIPGLKQSYKTLVFMPTSELDRYIHVLERINRVMNGPSDIKRENLYEVFIELMRQLSGDKLSKKDIDKADVDELRHLLAGIQAEGFDLEYKLGFRIQDIKNKKIVDESQLNLIAERVVKKLSKLREIRNLGDKYDFSYSVLNKESTYFWIETELLF